MADDLTHRAQMLYQRVADRPEGLPERGWIDLIALRNIMPDLLTRIEMLERENRKLREPFWEE